MSKIDLLDSTFLKDFRSSQIGEPYLHISVLDRPLVIQRASVLENSLLNSDFDNIDIIDTENHSDVVKNKFASENNILLLMRIKNRSKEEVVSGIDEALVKTLIDMLNVHAEDLFINTLGEIYIRQRKILSFDIKQIASNDNSCIYVFAIIYCKNNPEYSDIISGMQVKSIYGFIDDIYPIKNIYSFCQYIRSILINTFYIKEYSKNHTLVYIKEILARLGLSAQEETAEIVDNIYVSKIVLPELGMQQLGKGLTQEASLCSGYAEILERLQNLQFFPNSRDMFYSLEGSRFKAYPDERVLEDRVYVPFHSLDFGDNVYLDLEHIWDYQKSNGMSSGNTYNEALVQGLCEIFERYAENYIFDNNLTPPDVAIPFIRDNYYFQYCIIKDLEQKLNARIIVKDCSINNTLPVVALLIIDKKSKSFKKVFGSHPLFEEALNRCLSELLQKDMLDYTDIKNKNFTNIYLSKYSDKPYFKLMRACGHLGRVSIPSSFLCKKPSWDFVPWIAEDTLSNDIWINELLKICKDNNWEAFVRNNNFLGFPSIYIYIPDVSELPIQEYSYEQKQLDLLTHEQKSLKKEDVSKVLSYVENFEDSTCMATMDRDLLLIYLYFISGAYEKAVQLIRCKEDRSENLDCLAMELELRLDNVSEEDRDYILGTFYKKNVLDFIRRFWRNAEDSISIFRDEAFTKVRVDKGKFLLLKKIMLEKF